MLRKKPAKRYIGGALFCLLFGLSSTAFASAYQIWEQNGAGVGDYHAGGAAEANDASTNFYNAAGLIRIKKQEVVFGAAYVSTSIEYTGSVQVNTLSQQPFIVRPAQAGNKNLIPDFYYSTPLSPHWALGFGINVPFAAETDYGKSTVLRYIATETKLKTIDVSPSVAYQVSKNIAIGGGFDAQYMTGEFNSFGVLFDPSFDTASRNDAKAWGYGYHLGMLVMFTPHTRVGLNYRSQIVEHLRGDSRFRGPLANGFVGGSQTSTNLETTILTPPTTTLSVYHDFNKVWSMMASVFYTQWDKQSNLVLKNVAAINSTTFAADNTVSAKIHEGFRNTWNVALGIHYHPVLQWLFKMGIGYDETPTINRLRTLQLPDGNRYVIAFGVHFQATKQLGLDLGWTHLFVQKAKVAPPPQKISAQVSSLNGVVRSSGNIVGGQLTYDFI